ncbi:5-deoxy-glucuronate isomerase [Luteimonas saliphila]|uniref:5-deoxy-glucuronate isomerase n=1 Tax=Luteimonas saliphila TaxID=2804919 RepID=UPI00192DA22B|nr:5-deoxy-glucuronate isomerase [Luteimonas saliphila]
MSRLRVRPHAPGDDGSVLNVTPESAGWSHVGFKVVKLADGQCHEGGDAEREACLVLVAGAADIVAGGQCFGNVGGRASPFEDRAPGAVYVPAGVSYTVVAHGDVELAVCTAPGTGAGSPRRIEDADMSREVRGSGTNTRYVRNILPETEPAEGLLVVEVVTPAGHWSSYPPHKHDTATPGEETLLEETYYHRTQPRQGFAFQRVYSDDRSLDEAIAVEDGDVVLVPRGYHPVGAAHGYDLYYLNVMAGPERRWLFRNDPAHAWIVAPPPASGT